VAPSQSLQSIHSPLTNSEFPQSSQLQSQSEDPQLEERESKDPRGKQPEQSFVLVGVGGLSVAVGVPPQHGHVGLLIQSNGLIAQCSQHLGSPLNGLIQSVLQSQSAA
jgi:hypothetical protein